MSTIPRLVISAPSSGHGKTAISVGLLAALSARGYRAAGFKIGPDHVDAAYLGLAAGRPGRNLDPRMVGAKRIGPLFAHSAGSLDIAVVEGTMGLFDGLAGRTDSESTAQISGLLRAPVVLVVDVGAMGQSVAALVHGFRAYDELLWLGGVILNRVASSRHEQLLREALDDIGVPVLGALRRHALTDIGDAGAPLPSRHHGVAPVVHHNLDAVRAVRRLGEVIAGAVDIDRAMALARSAPRLTSEPWSAAEEVAAARGPEPAVTRIGRRPIIGVAFSYPETAELLTAAGAEVVPFDPLRDEFLPDGVDGLVVGGALPESYAEELGFNGRLRAAVAAHAAAGKPIAAEGTGLVWLCRDFNGRPMCGVVDASARETDLVVLGYREATARSSSVLLPVGAQVVGHKMHRTTINPRAGLQAAWTWAGGPAEGFVHRGVHASYLGLHWAGTPSIAARFVAATGATATPVQGQWTTPSTYPYNRPSVVTPQPPAGGTTLRFPAGAQPAATSLTKPAAATGPAEPAAATGPTEPAAATGLTEPAAATGPTRPAAPAASPVSVPGPVSAPGGFTAAPAGFVSAPREFAAPDTYSPPAPVVGPGAVAPVSAPSTTSPAPVSSPAVPASGPAAAPTSVPAAVPAQGGEADGIASSPFGPTSRAGAALVSAAQTSGPGSQAATQDGDPHAGSDDADEAAGAAPSSATVGASVGVPSTPNAPAPAAEMPSSGVVPTIVSAPPAPAQPSEVPPPAGAPVSGAGAAGSRPAEEAGMPPVSTAPGQQWPGAPATSAVVPVSPAPLPTVAAPVSAAPAGMTVIAAGSDLVAPDEAPTAYLQLPAQGRDPIGVGDQSPVSAPPAPDPAGDTPAHHPAPGATGPAAQEHSQRASQDDGPPTSGPPAGGATEAA
ncbi:cobyrinate a,c-diamide synthase [Dactylosporangium aurantiacum]|uniref:cobyrinate a,c-diamide synthase n=1 Tax=Dactylosporangium aurantiacum TaxID=35754 RepID=UPI0007C50517|nr:cobyrinate a,c-diamide synthase [Dactylosporangium aurantiacum]MDG6102077.1 cobyrinate a,c-diamide synthase [Dactylosporangium aurantiacum]